MQDRLWQQLASLVRKGSPFGDTGPNTRADHWVEPRLVCEVRFTEWTADGGLRHPIFLGMRDDKKPEDVRREDRSATEDDAAIESAAPDTAEDGGAGDRETANDAPAAGARESGPAP